MVSRADFTKGLELPGLIGNLVRDLNLSLCITSSISQIEINTAISNNHCNSGF